MPTNLYSPSRHNQARGNKKICALWATQAGVANTDWYNQIQSTLPGRMYDFRRYGLSPVKTITGEWALGLAWISNPFFARFFHSKK